MNSKGVSDTKAVLEHCLRLLSRKGRVTDLADMIHQQTGGSFHL